MEEVKEDDKRDADAWREDAEGILTFVSSNIWITIFVAMTSGQTGLFAATVGAFIIEFYKKLSPDSGDQTVDLLKQISRQLAGSSNGTDTNTENQSPSSETLMIWVMVMWMTSLVLSITSALVATLLQQWARRYTEMPNIPSKPAHRARVRSFAFHGTQLYKMSVAVQIPSALLHLSVFFFFGGLVALFHSVNKKVAIAVDVSVGLFGLAYFTLTILPCLDHRCPYRTPMSYLLWYPWHILLSLVALFGRSLIWLVHCLTVPPTLNDDLSNTQQKLLRWFGYFEESVKKHQRRLKDGFRESIIQGAINAPIGLDRKALTWLFRILALADKSKLSNFVASIPGDKAIELVTPPFDSGKIVFREPFLNLLQSYAAGPHVDGLEKDVLKRCRLSYLQVIHHMAKAFIVSDVNEAWTLTLLDDVRANFANISFMRDMWSDDDVVIRLTSRSLCALLAKRLLRKTQLGEADLRWLHEVTGVHAGMILNSPDIDAVLRKSFVCRVLEYNLPTEHATIFAETLAILLDAGVQVPFEKPDFRINLSTLIDSVEVDDGNTGVANRLREVFHDILEPSIPPASGHSAHIPPASASPAPGPPVPGPSASALLALAFPTPMPTPMPTTAPSAPATAPAFPTPTPTSAAQP